jgi:hypothetical protein
MYLYRHICGRTWEGLHLGLRVSAITNGKLARDKPMSFPGEMFLYIYGWEFNALDYSFAHGGAIFIDLVCDRFSLLEWA